METQGFEITYLSVDKYGLINLDELKKSIRPDTILVSIIHGNNEIGTIQDLASIGQICHERGVYFQTDASQSFTKTQIDLSKLNSKAKVPLLKDGKLFPAYESYEKYAKEVSLSPYLSFKLSK